jgi:hypothetical protein
MSDLAASAGHDNLPISTASGTMEFDTSMANLNELTN